MDDFEDTTLIALEDGSFILSDFSFETVFDTFFPPEDKDSEEFDDADRLSASTFEVALIDPTFLVLIFPVFELDPTSLKSLSALGPN